MTRVSIHREVRYLPAGLPCTPELIKQILGLSCKQSSSWLQDPAKSFEPKLSSSSLWLCHLTTTLAGFALVHGMPKDDLRCHKRKVPCSLSTAVSKVSCVQGDGGKVCCGLRYLLQDRSCLAYSLGSAGDTTFEQEIVKRTSCQVEHMSQAQPALHECQQKLFGGRGRGLSLCETLVSIDLVTGGKAAHAGAHLRPHTLSSCSRRCGKHPRHQLPPMGRGQPKQGGRYVHDFQTLKTFRADAFRCLGREPHCTLEVLVIQTV